MKNKIEAYLVEAISAFVVYTGIAALFRIIDGSIDWKAILTNALFFGLVWPIVQDGINRYRNNSNKE